MIETAGLTDREKNGSVKPRFGILLFSLLDPLTLKNSLGVPYGQPANS
jgi:hypothetical protein